MDQDTVLKETDAGMTKGVEHMIHEFSAVRTGKASPALVENIDVHIAAYGTKMKLNTLALITTPEARLILIQPFDPSNTQEIERGIRESKLGINPSVDGKNIRLPIPELSGERRQDLVKMIKGMAEDARVSMRAARKTAMDVTKKAKADSAITEDQMHDLEAEIQKLTDAHVKEIDQHVASKETEITTV
jgi:ribosome recycling factor